MGLFKRERAQGSDLLGMYDARRGRAGEAEGIARGLMPAGVALCFEQAPQLHRYKPSLAAGESPTSLARRA